MDLDHTSRGCKGHLRHTKTPIKSLPYLLGALLLILPGPHILLGSSHLNIMPNQPPIHFNPILSHNLNGMHLIRGGGSNTTLFSLFCLHHLHNHNCYLLIHKSNPKCLLSQIQTQTTDRISKCIVGNHHAQLMLWRFRKLTCDMGKFSQIASLYPGRLRKIKRTVNLKQFHPFLRDYSQKSSLPQKKLNSWEN